MIPLVNPLSNLEQNKSHAIHRLYKPSLGRKIMVCGTFG
jgi:hypothetical protein